MNVIIIEDENFAAQRLKEMLAEINPAIEVKAMLPSVAESVQWLMNNTTDLIFLDIQLSDGLSFSIFEQVTVNTPIIFTTAYNQYAIQAFDLNSIAYLLKPIRKTELAQSLNKYQNLKSAFSIDFERILAQMQGKQPDYKKRFLIQVGEKFRKVETHDIAYFYAFDKAVFMKTFTGKSYPVDFTLDALEQQLNPTLFFRINRKFFINMDAITDMAAYSRSRIKITLNPKPDEDMEAIVSIDRAADFRKWMNS